MIASRKVVEYRLGEDPSSAPVAYDVSGNCRNGAYTGFATRTSSVIEGDPDPAMINTSSTSGCDEINSLVDCDYATLGGGAQVQGGAKVNGGGQTATEHGLGTPGISGQVGHNWSLFTLPYDLGY